MQMQGRLESARPDHWDRFWTQPELGIQWKHRAAARLVELEPVLDIGSGSGIFLELLAKRGLRKLFACDRSIVSAGLAARRGFSAVCCDAEATLPFPSAAFGTVTMVDLLEHSFEPARILREARRVARDVVVVVPNFNSIWARFQVLLGRVPENNSPRKRHVYWFNYDALRELLSSVGLRVVSQDFHQFKNDHLILSRPLSALARLRPQLFSLAFAIKARANG